MFRQLILLLVCVYSAQSQAAVEPCPANIASICKNYGYCVILFGRDISCTCPVGYTGVYTGWLIIIYF